MQTLENIKKLAEWQISNADKQFNKYYEAENDMGMEYAMEWHSESKYRAIISKREYTTLLKFLERNPTPEYAQDRIQRRMDDLTELLIEAQFRPNSTSPMANIMQIWKCTEYGDIIREFREMLK